jgi:hypothetical protein
MTLKKVLLPCVRICWREPEEDDELLIVFILKSGWEDKHKVLPTLPFKLASIGRKGNKILILYDLAYEEGFLKEELKKFREKILDDLRRGRYGIVPEYREMAISYLDYLIEMEEYEDIWEVVDIARRARVLAYGGVRLGLPKDDGVRHYTIPIGRLPARKKPYEITIRPRRLQPGITHIKEIRLVTPVWKRGKAPIHCTEMERKFTFIKRNTPDIFQYPHLLKEKERAE